jgi:hypothetical protein
MDNRWKFFGTAAGKGADSFSGRPGKGPVVA